MTSELMFFVQWIGFLSIIGLALGVLAGLTLSVYMLLDTEFSGASVVTSVSVIGVLTVSGAIVGVLLPVLVGYKLYTDPEILFTTP